MEQTEPGPVEDEPITHGGARVVHPSVATLAAAVAGLPGRRALRSLPQTEVVTYLQDLEAQAHRIYAASLGAIADIDERGLPASMGPMSLPRFLGPLLRCTEAEARRRVRASRAVQETVTVTGTIVPPALGATGAALAEGAISGAHVDVIASVMSRLPNDLLVSDREYAEGILADAARTLTPTTVAAIGRRLVDTLDPDGEDPAKDEAAHAKKRGLWLRQLDDHSYELKARLTPDLGAKLRALIDFLSAPATRDKITAAETTAGEAEFATTSRGLLGLADDGLDPRTPCQRHLDALAEIIDTFLNGGSIDPIDVTSAPDGGRAGGDATPTDPAPAEASVTDDGAVDSSTRSHQTGPESAAQGSSAEGASADDRSVEGGSAASGATARRPARRGVVPQLILFGGVSDFAAKTGTAHTAQGDEIPMWAARQIVRDQASIFAVTLSTTGCVLDEGRGRRLATKPQIAAVIARDRGCTIRGCDRPISRCQVHHVREWVADTGPTNVDNLAAVCFWHHRWFAQLDYVCTMIDGVPHWTAPAWIDPGRIPRRHERFDVHTAGAA